MKVAILLLSVLVFTNAMSLIKEESSILEGIDAVQFVIQTYENGLDIIADQTYSFEHNKMKVQYTTFNGDIVPAFDIIYDFTEGTAYQYFNLTGECNSIQGSKMNLTEYVENLFKNHIEFAGRRGRNLMLYEVKHPEEEGSRTWVYGVYDNVDGEEVFVPTNFQSHHPVLNEDYAGKIIDTFSYPTLTEADFDYPACKDAKELKGELPSMSNTLGVRPGAFMKVAK